MNRGSVVGLLAVVVLFVLPQLCCAQSARMRAAADTLLNPALHPSAAKILSFDKKSENIGTIYESDAARDVVFTFTNVSNTPVTITKVTTHCGCTAASHNAQPVPPGGKSQVVVTYNPKGRSGTVDTDAFVYTSATGNKPVARLTILGNVVDTDEWSHLPCAMGSLRLKRTKVLLAKGRSEARIPCANVGKTPLELKAIGLPGYAAFRVEPLVMQPGEEGDIVIAVDAVKALGKGRFAIVVDGVAGNISSRTIKVTIEE